ncbi:hypothetical protein K432DRAFT_388161 [Lepidopterella palustris CBS 459.81]|uniref:Methyltransferase type 11 domain-containing protein n=1 Tax=Lepidopterella palustris CBS 459.81 TaxID=1314670 RepID=A0A8E2EKX2_9PEZI|nr:hypothetical protein K432DRAFT_388161 [Lepidopterella palustris CBS 459.81]
MFAADLSWTDPTDLTVGERKKRKKEQQSNSSKAPSVKSFTSSGTRRDGVWQSASKQSKYPSAQASNTPNNSMPKTLARPLIQSRASDRSVRLPSKALPPRPLDLKSDSTLKDPSLAPAWTFQSTLSPTLPSGASIDLPQSVIPDPDRETWSRHSRSSRSSSSRHSKDGTSTDLKSSERVMEKMVEVQQLSPKSFISRITSRSEEFVSPERTPVAPVTLQENVKHGKPLYSVEIQGCLDLQQFKFSEDDPEEVEGMVHTPPTEHCAAQQTSISPTLESWKAPSEWEVILATESHQNRSSSITADTIASDASSSSDLTHFQRFIRRMENAGPKIILDRLKEEWNDPVNEEADDELKLEKQLWVLTALQLQTLGRSVQPSQAAFGQLLRLPTLTHRRRILELYSNLAEVYQLSAMQPKEKIYYLSTKPQGAIPIPANVSYLSVPQAGLLPFPYATSSFDHIRASSLPSAIASSRLPQVFCECYRLIAPGGILEVRIMDSSPDRKTAGPKMRAWIEDRLSLNLEKYFRCSRPCTLVPGWVKEAGFSFLNNLPEKLMQTLRIPAAFDANDTVDDELLTLVGRALWKDIWGDLVEGRPGEPRWWWEDEEVLAECLERKTVFECGTLFAFKE